MTPPFNWPEMPPLDIHRVSQLIQILWLEMTHKAEQEAERDAHAEPGSPRHYGHGRWQFRVGADLGYKVIEILKAYDEGRTQQIELLKAELIRLHATQPQPVWIFANPPKDIKP